MDKLNFIKIKSFSKDIVRKIKRQATDWKKRTCIQKIMKNSQNVVTKQMTHFLKSATYLNTLPKK